MFRAWERGGNAVMAVGGEGDKQTIITYKPRNFLSLSVNSSFIL